MRYFIMGILIGRCLAADAQYVPTSSQPFQFASLYNPAFTGIEPYGDLRLGYRNQWTGFGSNAPKFIQLAYNFRVQQPADLDRKSTRLNSSHSSISYAV